MVKFKAALAVAALFFVQILAADAVNSGAALSQNFARASEILSGQNLSSKNRLDVAKIVQILKQNALFDAVSFSSPTLNLKFKTAAQTPAALFIKGVNLSLKTLGAQMLRVSEVGNFEPKIYGGVVAKNGGIDPVSLANAFSANGVFITEISRESGALAVTLDFTEANLAGEQNTAASFDALIPLAKSNSPYFINLNGAKSLQISSSEQNSWMPQIFVYDKNLVQITKFEETEVKSEFASDLPTGAKYVIIGDIVDMGNIKNELVIKLAK